MKSSLSLLTLTVGLLTLVPGATLVEAAFPAVVDDFNNADATTIGAPRLVIGDDSMGGKSSLEHTIADGVITASGKIAPARGQPGFVSLVLPLAGPGEGADLSDYQGIRLRLRVTNGNLSVSANSTEVTNYDYHAASITRSTDGEFHEVLIPWTQLKRAWSEQTKLNPATINSLSLVAAAMQPSAFAYEIDEVGFY